LQDTFTRRLDAVTAATEAHIKSLLGKTPLAGEIARPARLLAAMRHATEGGKRIRPFLVIESAALFAVPEKQALPVGTALECVHCYSLVHDDLPAMDDDDLRRGRPTVHRAFDDATAILVGDALLTLAFDILARETTHLDASTRIALVLVLARASGLGGMVGGQMLDLEAEGRFTSDAKPLSLSATEISTLQSMKTGALLSAACEAGAILGRADKESKNSLMKFAHVFGLAFQLSDDMIDAEGDVKTVGKRVGKDADRGKATLVSKLGSSGARKKLSELIAEAETSLSVFGEKAAMLVSAAKFLATREH
jgi:farnesyl diphosphate synthase